MTPKLLTFKLYVNLEQKRFQIENALKIKKIYIINI